MSPQSVLGQCHAFYYVHVLFNPLNSPMWEAMLSPTSQMKSLMHPVQDTLRQPQNQDSNPADHRARALQHCLYCLQPRADTACPKLALKLRRKDLDLRHSLASSTLA